MEKKTVFTFPCKREDIDKCNDIEQLMEWDKQFDSELAKAEFSFGEGFVGANPKLQGFLFANEKNQKAIKNKLSFLNRPVSPIRALRMFHDVVKSFDNITIQSNGENVNFYEYAVNMALDKLNRKGHDFAKMIDADKGKGKNLKK